MMIDRRELLHRASMLLGGALSSGTVAGVLAGCVSTPEGQAGAKTFFSPEEMATITAMSDQIIPRDQTPGAIDAGVPAFIDRMIAGYYKDRERNIMRAGMRQVATDALELGGKPFAEITPEQQVALMKEYDRLAYEQRAQGDPHFFRLMKELTIVGFCTSEAGATKFLRYAQTPGQLRMDVPYSEIGKAWAT
jgi:gluconate 2-dehydrogenase gamma chain